MVRRLLMAVAVVLCARDARALTTDALLDSLQHTAFDFFWNEANPGNGLIKDRSTPFSPCSIASLGFGLSAICIGIDHGWVSRADGGNRIRTALQTLWNGPQGSGTTGIIGYKGFYYHFLDMVSAQRTWNSELSTIDSALLFAGVLDAKQYFSTGDPLDIDIRALADSIYNRADWEFARNFQPGIYMGWQPVTGFANFGLWGGYNEAMILYILALGSPTHPVPTTTWSYWTSGYIWQTSNGYSFIRFPPLFGHQYSHCWVDFRYIQDSYMQSQMITYWENSRRATLAQRNYCIANPSHFVGYGENVWGITACDDPYGYAAHGAPPAQNDNGTIAPTAVAGSIAFAPGVCIPTLHNFYDTYGSQLWSTYGFKDAFNLTVNWWDTDYIGIDQGPIIIMIENYRNQSVWNRFMQNPDIQRGLDRAGFVSNTTVSVGPTAHAIDVALGQNAPNPVRGTTWIPFRLGAAGRVAIVLHDVAGHRVREVFAGERGPGEQVIPLDTGDLPSGVYWYRLEYEGKSISKQCIVLK
jgi:hypothetical protein